MEENRKYLPITEDEFVNIKGMLESVSQTAAARASGRGNATVWIINKADSFEDYLNIRNEHNGANTHRAKRAESSFTHGEMDEAIEAENKSAGTRNTGGGWKQLNQDSFKRIHDLYNLDVPKAQISKIVNKSYGTVTEVLKAKDWEDYGRIKEDWKIKKRISEAKINGELFEAPVVPTSINEVQQLVNEFRNKYEELNSSLTKMGY